MTTGTNPKPSTAIRRWAIEQLDLQSGMPAREARQKLLKQLGEMDFMPPGGWDSALRVLGIAAGDGDQNGPALLPPRRAAEDSLREEVEAFAARFFSLAPNTRIAHYQELLRRCAGVPAVAGRLEMLSPALELPCELPPGQTHDVANLLEQARCLCVLPRQERASCRMAFLQECGTDLTRWQQAASLVQAKFARYAALEPTLFRELAASGDREKSRERIARQRRRMVRKARTTKTVASTSQKSPWWIGIAAVVVLNIVRVIFTGNHSYNTVPPSPPPYNEQQTKEQINKALREGRLYGFPPSNDPSPPLFSPGVPQGSPNQQFEQDRQRMQDLMRGLDGPSPPSGTP